MIDKDTIIQEMITYIHSSAPIPRTKIYQWMQCKDIDIMGITADFVTWASYIERIDEEIEQKDLEAFLFKYYERCLIEDPDSDWAETRYGVGWVINAWFRAVPQDVDPATSSFIAHLKDWLTEVYLKSGKDIRQAIVGGALEHILEQKRWWDFFQDWKDNPSLLPAYERAMEWAVDHLEQT